jgi:hypothetical protein
MTLDDFKKWVHELAYAGDVKQHFQFVEQNDEIIRIKFYTDVNIYSITASAPKAEGKSYLGCAVSKRKALAGEDHTRGNDLHDGELTRETWDTILADIVSYEMVPLNIRPATPLPDDSTQTKKE